MKGHLNVKKTRDLQEATAENQSTHYSLVCELLHFPAAAGEQNQPKQASQEKAQPECGSRATAELNADALSGTLGPRFSLLLFTG